MRRTLTLGVSLLVVASWLLSCSTQKNTAKSRFWHAFNARYNTYYNGSLAYIEGSLEKENNHKDNFTELIPLYPVGSKTSREIGKSQFDRAIEKSKKAIKQHSIKRRPVWDKHRRKTERDIEWLNRREYNPFLWKAWMLLGRSQFHEGAFEEAASTFAYMSRLYATQPAIYGKARAWLVKCYAELDWLYDAEDVITNMKRDSLDWRAVKEWDYAYTSYYIRARKYAEAIPYLRKVIRHEMRRKQRAREWYLLGQLYRATGQREAAYKAFKRVIRQNPPYELAFNARVALTEVAAESDTKRMISQLKRMAASDKNKDYLEQVYYAMGNIYLARRDTMRAIDAYERGNTLATRSGIEKGVLLAKLGDLYWAKDRFVDAQRCYGEAIGLLDKDREGYTEMSHRSTVLDELAPHLEAVHLQDSLQQLARMDEKERNAAIDRVIEALKKKEREQGDTLANGEGQQAGNANQSSTQRTQQSATSSSTKTSWYFYNPMAVSQGKETFQKLWGKRKNEDNWQRKNKTVVASTMESDEEATTPTDSVGNQEDTHEKEAAAPEESDPHKRAYYLAQIPFSAEQLAASNATLENGLFNSGVLFKDKLDLLPQSEKQLLRLVRQYPDYEKMDETYYHLWLLYQRKGQPAEADRYLSLLKANHTESKWTKLLADPHYAENMRIGDHLEDSLYAATYEAFKANQFTTVHENTNFSATRFPDGKYRDKFVFINGLSKLNEGNTQECIDDMQLVVKDFPQSEVSEMAGMIINGVKAGRRIYGGTFDMNSVWERRTITLNNTDSTAAPAFTAQRDDKFVFLLVYNPDSVNENQLFFELARHNFTNFLVRNFGVEIEEEGGMHRMRVSGFNSYDEGLQYARQLFSNERVATVATACRRVLISEPNLQLIGKAFSYEDYAAFYEEHFLPLRISTVRLLTEPTEIEYEPSPEQPTTNDELYNGGVVDDGMLLELGVEKEPASQEIVIPVELEKQVEEKQPLEPSTTIEVVTEPKDVQNTSSQSVESGIEVAVPQPTTRSDKNASEPSVEKSSAKKGEKSNEKTKERPVAKSTTQPAQKPTTKKQAQTKESQPVRTQTVIDTGIDFNDGFGSQIRRQKEGISTPVDSTKTQKKKTEKEKKIPTVEDEYYDLGGF